MDGNQLDDDRVGENSETNGVEGAADTVPDVRIEGSPALAVFNNKLYVAHRGCKTDIYSGFEVWFGTFNGGNWAPEDLVPGVTTVCSPAIAAFNNKLYMVHQGRIGYSIYGSAFDGTSWSKDKVISDFCTTDTPALAMFNGQLFMAYRGCAWGEYQGNEIWWATTSDGVNWNGSGRAIPGVAITGYPALAVYNSVLYVFYQGAGEHSGSLRYTYTYDGSTWASEAVVPNVVMSESPAATVFSGRLYVAHQGSSRTGQSRWLWYVTFDGTAWSPDRPRTTPYMYNSPALCMYDNTLYWAETADQNALNVQTAPYEWIDCQVPLLDVWGEGRRNDTGIVTGFYGYQNLNKVGKQIDNGPMPIPDLVPVDSYGPPTDSRPLVFPIKDD